MGGITSQQQHEERKSNIRDLTDTDNMSATSSQRQNTSRGQLLKDVTSCEANLHKHIICEKNPGHLKFIPVSQFVENHLPDDVEDKETVVKYVKLWSEFVVHIKVGRVGENRPQYYPGSTDKYPFYNPNGELRIRTGSGYVEIAGIRIRNSGPCPCKDCRASPSPKEGWWEIHVITAACVLCDQSEVEDTTVKLFYDGDDTQPVTLQGHRLVETHIVGDMCHFTCITHDEHVVDRLARAELGIRDRRLSRDCPADLAIVMSHPHGRSKHVTVGRQVGVDGRTVSYDASTCPGSSGGLVVVGAYIQNELLGGFVHPHSTALPGWINRSGDWTRF